MPLQNEPNASHGVACVVDDDARVDRVEVVAVVGRDRPAPVDPFVVGVVGVERRVRRERDHRGVRPERATPSSTGTRCRRARRARAPTGCRRRARPRRATRASRPRPRPRSASRAVGRRPDLDVAVGDGAVARRVHVPVSPSATETPGRATARSPVRSRDRRRRCARGEREGHGCREQRAEAEAAHRAATRGSGRPVRLRCGAAAWTTAAPRRASAERDRPSTTPAAASR